MFLVESICINLFFGDIEKMAEKNSVESRVIRVVAEQLGINESDIKPESHIVDDLKADSLDTVELVMEIEKEFDIEVPEGEAEKLLTVQAIIDNVIIQKPELAWIPIRKEK